MRSEGVFRAVMVQPEKVHFVKNDRKQCADCDVYKQKEALLAELTLLSDTSTYSSQSVCISINTPFLHAPGTLHALGVSAVLLLRPRVLSFPLSGGWRVPDGANVDGST